MNESGFQQNMVFYIATLVNQVNADGIVRADEIKYLKDITNFYSKIYGSFEYEDMMIKIQQLSNDDWNDWKTKMQTNPVVVRSLLRDMITLSYVDMDFNHLEKKAIDSFAREMNIPTATVDRLIKLVQENISSAIALNNIVINGE